MGYAGQERRIHKVFVTRNTEYHVRRETCVAVRDRRTGQWLRGHLALRSKVTGAIRFTSDGGIVPNTGSPTVGDSLFLQVGGRDLVTSAIVSIERPPRDVVALYPT
ncbi:MAG: hypothetical protein NZ898_08340 [Myxococcota bacterium]|nr:hypothetical protein [Myxococcota bacterium]MDW8361913.1 hypothetical protein [Myxococcales bacterium]